MPGDSQTDRRTRRGYLIVVVLLAAAVTIFNVDAIADLTRDRLDLVAVVSEAGGIRVGSAIWVAGVEAGRVTGLSFLPSGQDAEVAVHMRLEGRVRDVIRLDSDVRATRLRFIGQPIIQIGAGSGGAPEVVSGDTLRPGPRTTPQELLEQGKAFPAALDSLVTSSRRIVALVEAQRPELARIAQRLEAVTAAADALSTSLRTGSLGRIMSDDILTTRLGALGDRVGELQQALGSLGRYLPSDDPEAGPLARELAGLQRRADSVAEGVAQLQARLERGEGFLPRMQQDSALMMAVRGVQARVDSLLAEVESIALRMVVP